MGAQDYTPNNDEPLESIVAVKALFQRAIEE